MKMPDSISAIAASVSPEADIHCMQPGEAEGVVHLMHEVYRDTYPKKYVYDPEQIRKKNASGEVTSIVATSPEGRVIGYAAMNAYYGYPRIGLVGSLAVSPSCRGQGLGGMISRYLLPCSDGRGFVSLTGGAFTAHRYSQWAISRLGFSTSAILLGSQPQGISFQGIADTLAQRETVVFFSRLLCLPEYGPQHLPENHREMILDLAGGLGIGILDDRTPSAGHEPTIIECSVNEETGAGMIWFRSAGPDPREILAGTMRQLRHRGATVLRLHLDLSDPGTPAAARAAEEEGFVFAGILPGESGLVLLLQHLQDVRIDVGRIQMGNPSGERLLAYIKAQPGFHQNAVKFPVRKTEMKAQT